MTLAIPVGKLRIQFTGSILPSTSIIGLFGLARMIILTVALPGDGGLVLITSYTESTWTSYSAELKAGLQL